MKIALIPEERLINLINRRENNIVYDEETLNLVNELKEKKFFIRKKYFNSPEKWVINLMASRMINNKEKTYDDLIKKIYNRTKFLNQSMSFKDRLIIIYHGLYEMPKCRFCGKEIKITPPLALGFNETCGNNKCMVALGTENRGGIGYSVGLKKPEQVERFKKAIGTIWQDFTRGKNYDEIYGKKKSDEVKEKMSLGTDPLKKGYFSKYRCEKINPNTENIITLMSSYEINAFEFFIQNNIWFEKSFEKLKYWNSVVKGYRYYNPDFEIKYNNKHFIVEIKPKNFLGNQKDDYSIITADKIKCLKDFCEKENKICLIITEDHLFLNVENFKKLLKKGISNYNVYMENGFENKIN